MKRKRKPKNSLKMKISPLTISAFIFFIFVLFSVCPVESLNFNHTNPNIRPADQSEKHRPHVMKINKNSLKTIQSPDGDIIDCVLTHKQPAFDLPQLRGQKPLDPPDLPKGYKSTTGISEDNFQVWSMSNETCPEGTIPIRRTTEQDFLRGNLKKSVVRKDSTSNGHEHAIGYVDGGEYYGAEALINVWAPIVANRNEFSIAQMWVIAGTPEVDLNTVEAGWQVFEDNKPRLFVFWTGDAYKSTGCYNLECPGFVQTNTKIALGATISPVSLYNGKQTAINVLVWKDPFKGDWWLMVEGMTIGYWPSSLFTHLRDHAASVQFGGEIVNIPIDGSHTSTQMGSGHFAEEGPDKAAYFGNLNVVDRDYNVNPVQGLEFFVETPNCYNIQGHLDEDGATFFNYGGPGKNPRCP